MYGKKLLQEILEGYGFTAVPQELKDEGFGCHYCDDTNKKKNYYCDMSLIPDGYENLVVYRKKMDKIRQESWCDVCLYTTEVELMRNSILT